MVLVAASEKQIRTYGNWKQPKSAGLLGLGSKGTMVLFGALIMTILIVMVRGLWWGLGSLVIVAVVVMVLVLRDSHGKSILDRATTRFGFMGSKMGRGDVYRSGVVGVTPWGRTQLPGLAAQSTLSEHVDSFGRPFALIHMPSTGTATVVLSAEPDGSSLVDSDQVDTWVADWGHWLSNLGTEPGLVGVSVTIETAPDTGTRLRTEVTHAMQEDAPAFARAVLHQVMDTYPAGSSAIRAYVALTFTLSKRARNAKKKMQEMGRELASRLPGLTEDLQATGAGAVAPLDASSLCEVIRVAYDPDAGPLVDEAHLSDEESPLDWSNVGPVATDAGWDSYRHDSGVSMTWEMTQAPRGHVQAGVLARLLAPHRDIARKRVTLLYRPIDAALAATLVETDVRSAEFNMNQASKPTARARMALRSAESIASEEAAGAGLTNFGMLVTATVLDEDRLADARAAVSNLGATARLRLRPCYGAQDTAFAAALPLGLVLRRHVKVPSAFQETN